jgi:hypothetical protein
MSPVPSKSQPPVSFLSLPAELRQSILFHAYTEVYDQWTARRINLWRLRRQSQRWAAQMHKVHDGIIEDVNFVASKGYERVPMAGVGGDKMRLYKISSIRCVDWSG